MLAGTEESNGCGQCHRGTHHPFVEQWENSAHGNVTPFPADQESCNGCHSGNGALDRWGTNAKYLEREDMIPGSGKVAQPGLIGVAPGSGEIIWPPVSVCQ